MSDRIFCRWAVKINAGWILNRNANMIIKEADDKRTQIETLQSLLERSDATPDIRKRIEQELRNIRAGMKGETEAAYEIGFHFGPSKNWAIIHDLRIECDGRIAQIDHIVINRLLDIYVCESKHFSEGIAINEHGECSAFFGGKPYGVASPFEQNKKHITVLDSVFKTGMVKLPSRLGFTLTPNIKSLVIVSKSARISRPKSSFDGIDSIIKNDQFREKIDKQMDADNSPLLLAKMIGVETLESLASDIAALHKPIAFNWAAKFGLPQTYTAPTASSVTDKSPTTPIEASEESAKPKQKLVCAACNQPVAYNVAKFCWFNKPKFGGNIYCMDCQKTV